MSLGVFELRRLLVRQWTSRPGRALATIASVAVAVGAVVATWVAADASRAGYKKLTSSIEGVPAVDILSKAGGRFEASDLPSLANLPGVRLHDLRHTVASIGAGASLGLPIVGKLLGHSQPPTTARYAHLDAASLRRAANIIGDQLSAALGRGAATGGGGTSGSN